MTMEAELKGLLPIYEEAVKKDPYLPIIEAITNAFDSIIKANPSNKTVRVSFVTNQSSLLVGQVAQQIDEIVIEDCGTGFDDGNAISFKRVGSTHKEDMGCKGMGRLSWLCRFKRVVIESTYKHGETLRYRELHFSLDKEVEEKENKPADPKATQPRTKVRLLEPLTNIYDDKRLSISFVNQIKRVFVPYLIQHQNLSIYVDMVDGQSETIDYANLNIKSLPTQPLNEVDFTVYCLSSDIKLTSAHHAYNLCGDNRVVKSESLDIYPNEKLAVDGQNPAYLYFFIISDYLNERVSTTRDSFKILEKRPSLELEPEALYMEEIKNHIIEIANAYAQQHIEEANNKKNTVIQEVIQEYPHLAKSVETLNPKIGYGHTKEKIIIEAVTEQARHAEQVKKQLLEAAQKPLSKATDAEKENLAKTIAEVTHENSLQLGHYMAYRKVVLDLLDKYLQYQDDTGTFPLEEHLHQIICPMRESHETLTSHEHNLWLLDDRLMLLKEFYSDCSLASAGKADSRKEADILFEKPLVVAESKSANTLNNVAVVEFKRPGREITKGDELKEVITKYVDPLQNGKYTHKGQQLKKADRITHAYTVLTLTDGTRNTLENYEGYKPSCNRDAFSRPYEGFNCIHYVVDWARLIQDAKDRHEFFFQKLNA